MNAIKFLRKKYNVPPDKQLNEVINSFHFTVGTVCELLEDYKEMTLNNKNNG